MPSPYLRLELEYVTQESQIVVHVIQRVVSLAQDRPGISRRTEQHVEQSALGVAARIRPQPLSYGVRADALDVCGGSSGLPVEVDAVPNQVAAVRGQGEL